MRELFALYDPEKNGEVPTETLIDLIRTYARLPGTLPLRPSSARAGSTRSDFGAAVERPRSAVISAAARKVFQRPLSATAPVPRLLNPSVDKLDKLVCAADGAAQQQCVSQRSPQDKSFDNSTVASSPLTGVRAAAPAAVAASSATTAATSLLSRLYTRRASVRELMTEWDVGDTGGLPASEVSMVLTVLGVESSNSEMNALLQMVDPQSSGHVRCVAAAFLWFPWRRQFTPAIWPFTAGWRHARAHTHDAHTSTLAHGRACLDDQFTPTH
eukprot:6197010-Pleurochrysis_carterae.AAC.5